MRAALRRSPDRPDQLRAELRSPAHAGVVMQRLLPTFEQRETTLRAHIDRVVSVGVPDCYPQAFERWRQDLADLGSASATVTALGPLAVGLGNASPLEVGLTLHHTYGVPYVPGSGLKGVAWRAAALNGVDPHDVKVIFGTEGEDAGDAEGAAAASGTQPSAGFATFWDGLLVPSRTSPLRGDVITVHHQRYYGSHGTQAEPTDFDDPNPVGFVSVPPGNRFLVAVACESSAEIADAGLALLLWGLENLGVGGKTAAGYGRLANRGQWR